jgi:hypothetical protein
VKDPVRSLVTGLPLDLRFRTKGQLAASSFRITLAAGTTMTCADAVRKLLGDCKGWDLRSAGKRSKSDTWYAWAWIATASPRRHLLIRRHLKTGELAFHLCHVPDGQVLTKARLINAAGLRWPVEEGFEFSKDYVGLDQCQTRLYTAIRRHLVLVMAALAICAVTAAQLRHATDAQAPPPATPDQPPPADPGLSDGCHGLISHVRSGSSAWPSAARIRSTAAHAVRGAAA